MIKKIYKILQKTEKGYKVIYVGQTNLPLMKRFFQHVSNWLEPLVLKIGIKQFRIVCIAYASGSKSEIALEEEYWSMYYRRYFDLFNKNDGYSDVNWKNPMKGKGYLISGNKNGAKKTKHKYVKKKYKILCIQTNQIFESLSQVKKVLKLKAFNSSSMKKKVFWKTEDNEIKFFQFKEIS